MQRHRRKYCELITVRIYVCCRQRIWELETVSNSQKPSLLGAWLSFRFHGSSEPLSKNVLIFRHTSETLTLKVKHYINVHNNISL